MSFFLTQKRYLFHLFLSKTTLNPINFTVLTFCFLQIILFFFFTQRKKVMVWNDIRCLWYKHSIQILFLIQTDNPNFTVEKNVKTAAGNQTGTDISVTVHFEPCQVGDIQSLLTISSDFGGEYVFPLYGSCTPPKAQGPLIISSGSSVSISFKNVFQQATTFSFQVDNPAFTVKGAETILPQKTQHIQVIFDGAPAGSRGPCHGKLTISCPRMEGHGQGIFWVYYLKGYCPELPSEKRTS